MMAVLVSSQTPYEKPNYTSYSFPEYKQEYNQDQEYPEVYKPYLDSTPVYNKPVHTHAKFKPYLHYGTLFRPYYPIFKPNYREPETLYRHLRYSSRWYPTHATYDTAYLFYK
jgi:hypothetical protein